MSEKNEIIYVYDCSSLIEGDYGLNVLEVEEYETFIKKEPQFEAKPYILKSRYDELSLENARLAADLESLKAELEKVKESKEYKHTIKCSLPELTEKQKEQLSQLTKEATHVLTIDLNGHHIMQTIEEYNQQNKPTK